MSIPADAHRVNVSGTTVVPGLIDTHAHLHYSGFEVLPAPVFDTISDAAPEDRLSTTRSLVMELAARLYYRAAGYF